MMMVLDLEPMDLDHGFAMDVGFLNGESEKTLESRYHAQPEGFHQALKNLQVDYLRLSIDGISKMVYNGKSH